MTKPAEERRAIAASFEPILGAQCADLRKALRLAMLMLRERDDALARAGTTLQLMHNNFRAIKGLPPQARPKRDDSLDRRRQAYLRQVREWWRL